ncbi:8-amino-7-oxononanoate synthase [Caulobacter sp. S45]|uniref:aminotransferase class I/II-fold pyridoxal phosphate-dependent enzyme n=1 Tax=Caulobacter sp. S45 TaxID=1641861 RepID=UPI00131B7605|nr:8-amino-7-oxononanoate synthase [Caulobacter sp. S45]
MDSLDAFARGKLSSLEAAALRRDLVPTHRLQGVRVERGGRELISFSCNDYLGLAQDPRVKAAAIAAVERYGTGAGASRLVTGDHPLLGQLERALARHKGAEAGLVFGSGYLTNIGVTPALVGRGDLVLLDALSHACMFAGAKLSGAEVGIFRHNDLEDLAGRLAGRHAGVGRTLVLTERVFSMDGDRAPVAEMNALAASHDAWLMVDDAHGLGVIEPEARAPLEMGTLSKALGSYGGYLCASAPVVDLLKSRARSFVYTTGLPPASAAAALAALEILEAEPDRCSRPLALARQFTEAMGLPLAESAIVPVIVGASSRALALSQALQAHGFLVVAIRPPTVPEGQARLRLAFSAAHAEAEVDAVAHALKPLLETIR